MLKTMIYGLSKPNSELMVGCESHKDIMQLLNTTRFIGRSATIRKLIILAMYRSACHGIGSYSHLYKCIFYILQNA